MAAGPLLDPDGNPAIFPATEGSPEAPGFTASYVDGQIICDSPNGYVVTRQTSNDPAEARGVVIFDETNPTTGTAWVPPWGVTYFRIWQHP